jgi:threonine synthase
MHYFSLSNSDLKAGFSAAMRMGLAPDKGLFFPERIPEFNASLGAWNQERPLSFWGTEVMVPFAEGDVAADRVKSCMVEALSMPIELVELEPGLHVLELFHGPTAAFKDVGARAMSRLLAETNEGELTVLVATSGDTGSAVAQGFLNAPGIRVVILYPSGRISQTQEKQLTTCGANITALEVKGSFDDCQAMVKEAFMDEELQGQRPLTSANSINISRWIPQATYFAWASDKLGEEAHFVVPSGNFGNLAAGLWAHRMGMPALGFTAATNENDVIPAYLASGTFTAKPSVATLSNAMDVGDPSNRPRVEALYGNSFHAMQAELRTTSATDEETRNAMTAANRDFQYLACPHSAIAIASAREGLRDGSIQGPVIVLSTAHPAKFGEHVYAATGVKPSLPFALASSQEKPKVSLLVEPTYSALRKYLLG